MEQESSRDMGPPEGFEIVWESPQTVQASTTKRVRKWELYLQPIKAAPGTEARVFRAKSRTDASSKKTQIQNRMLKMDPMGNWRVDVYQMHDADGGYGIFVTYLGQLSQQEKRERDLKRAERKAEYQRRHALRKAKEDLQRIAAELPPQTPRPW